MAPAQNKPKEDCDCENCVKSREALKTFNVTQAEADDCNDFLSKALANKDRITVIAEVFTEYWENKNLLSYSFFQLGRVHERQEQSELGKSIISKLFS